MQKWQLEQFAEYITEPTECPPATLRQVFIMCFNDTWWVRFDWLYQQFKALKCYFSFLRYITAHSYGLYEIGFTEFLNEWIN